MKHLRIFTSVLLLFACAYARADEGMWLPSLISERIADMQAKGFRLDAEDVYSINRASLKDAVVLFGSGCTGELVSDEGLLFTNHHCGYSYIQKHSSVEHDYLKDGFWAMNRDEELPNPGLTVSFLDHMQDVTGAVLSGYDPATMDEACRDSIVAVRSKALIAEAVKDGKGLKASVEALFYGNSYYLFVFRVYRDVRLVGAPPSSIGKFGGDTDNWMWPRHTGDFSIFRIYADKDGNPADYSEDNVPYRPKKSFTVSRAGVNEGDFTFVYGCPGSTKEYVLSDEVEYVSEVSDPEKIALRTLRLESMKKHMALSPAVRIQYSAKAQSVSNAWKKWQGEMKGIRDNGTVQVKREAEKEFNKWAQGTEYEGLTERLSQLYALRAPVYRAYEYYTECIRTIEILQFASSVKTALGTSQLQSVAQSFYKDYYRPIDEEVFSQMIAAFDRELPDSLKPAFHKEMMDFYGSADKWMEDLFSRTLFTDRERVLALTEDDADAVASDPAYVMYKAYYDWYMHDIRPQVSDVNARITLLNRDYMRAQMEAEPERQFYPDANLTLRIAYGHVEGYTPSDGIYYKPVSTLKGIIEKDNPDIFDYNIPQSLRDIYAEGGHEDQPVCFLATNHTTGGNSGSPIINADGQLIGINFDRVWEGTMSDLSFDPSICRNISLDIRYLLFTIEHIGHASYLFDEMHFAD